MTSPDNKPHAAAHSAARRVARLAAVVGVAALAVIAPLAGTSLAAQTIPGAVLAQREPHHHVAYSDSVMRVLRVRVPMHDSTLLHEHGPDYFWIALGPSEVVNAKPGVPDATIKSADLSVHYTPGKFAHVARNPGASPFDNITIELLGAQTHVHNLCEPALGGQPLDCQKPSSGSAASISGATEHPAFSTDQLRVSVVTIDGGATMRARGAPRTWVIALDTADATSALKIEGRGAWTGGVYRADGGDAVVRNSASHAVRVLAVEQQRAR